MLVTTLLILFGRATDVTLGTLRIVSVVRGDKAQAFILGILEIGIWITILSRVVTDLADHPIYGVAYAIGFGLGNLLGITAEQWLGRGYQVIRIFTRKGDIVVDKLREAGHEVTAFQGEGLQGPISLLFVETGTRNTEHIRALAEEFDPECFYVVDDILLSSSLRSRRQRKGK